MAEHTPTMQPRRSGVSRRTIVKGAAWAVPVTAVVGAAPAFAASGPGPGELVGVVAYIKSCYPDAPLLPGFLEIDGTQPGAQLYVTALNGDGGPPEVTVTIFLNYSDWSFTQDLGANGWSNLVRFGSADGTAGAAAPYAYRTTYSTARADWTFDDVLTRWVPTGKPYFKSSEFIGCVPITTVVDRKVVLNGEEVTTRRGPASV